MKGSTLNVLVIHVLVIHVLVIQMPIVCNSVVLVPVDEITDFAGSQVIFFLFSIGHCDVDNTGVKVPVDYEKRSIGHSNFMRKN